MEPIGTSRVRFDDEPLNEAVVSLIEEQLKSGRDVPSPVLMEKGESFEIVDGRNRIEAARRIGMTTISAYVVKEMSDEKRQEIRRGLNQQRNQN